MSPVRSSCYAKQNGMPSAMVGMAKRAGIPSDLARSLVDRARALQASGNYRGARADLDEARTVERTVADARVRANLDVDLAAAETEIAAFGDADAALAS